MKRIIVCVCVCVCQASCAELGGLLDALRAEIADLQVVSGAPKYLPDVCSSV